LVRSAKHSCENAEASDEHFKQDILEISMTKTRSIITAIAVVLALGSFWPGNLAAQGLFGTISGAVTDATGAVIPNAAVTITNVDTNVATTITTNGSGDYSVSGLNPGIYRVEASAKGFKNEVQNSIVLEVDGNPRQVSSCKLVRPLKR